MGPSRVIITETWGFHCTVWAEAEEITEHPKQPLVKFDIQKLNGDLSYSSSLTVGWTWSTVSMLDRHSNLLLRVSKCSLSVRELCTNLISTGNNRAQAPETLHCKDISCPLCAQLFHVVYCCQIIALKFVMPSKTNRWPANQITLDLISLIISSEQYQSSSSPLSFIHTNSCTFSYNYVSVF